MPMRSLVAFAGESLSTAFELEQPLHKLSSTPI